MKTVIESYVGIWAIMLFLMLCISFTSINMNVVQARNIYNSVRSEVMASNGAVVNSTGPFTYNSSDASHGANCISAAKDGYQFSYKITRQSAVDSDKTADNQTFKYNSIYKIELKYTYAVPLFGEQVYLISGLAY